MNNLDISNDFQMLENKTFLLHRNPLAFKTLVLNKPSVKTDLLLLQSTVHSDRINMIDQDLLHNSKSAFKGLNMSWVSFLLNPTVLSYLLFNT